jgi:hypothetical protein
MSSTCQHARVHFVSREWWLLPKPLAVPQRADQQAVCHVGLPVGALLRLKRKRLGHFEVCR